MIMHYSVAYCIFAYMIVRLCLATMVVYKLYTAWLIHYEINKENSCLY